MARRGRPAIKAGEASVPVNVRIPESLFDKLCQVARAESYKQGREVSVAEVVRSPSVSIADLAKSLSSVRADVAALRDDMDSLRGVQPTQSDPDVDELIADFIKKSIEMGLGFDAA